MIFRLLKHVSSAGVAEIYLSQFGRWKICTVNPSHGGFMRMLEKNTVKPKKHLTVKNCGCSRLLILSSFRHTKMCWTVM